MRNIGVWVCTTLYMQAYLGVFSESNKSVEPVWRKHTLLLLKKHSSFLFCNFYHLQKQFIKKFFMMLYIDYVQGHIIIQLKVTDCYHCAEVKDQRW